jgi:RNA polymerase sigma factor (TIGR02999 family)
MPEKREATTHDVTRILNEFKQGRLDSTNALIPVVYNELRQIAAHRLDLELPGQTLQATALVHEAYLRLISPEVQSWQNRRHFFGAAAEAMRRILIENARRKRALKRGAAPEKADLDVDKLPVQSTSVDILDLNSALEELEKFDPEAAELVKLRHFAGFTRDQIAKILGVSPRTVDNLWVFAKAWLYRRLNES